MNMRPSSVLKKLRNGEVVNSIKTNLGDHRSAEIAAMCGIDCVWADMEHVPNDFSVIERQILAAKAYDVDTIVRVARGGYSDYIRPLEMDAAGIMVPHIMSLEDAKKIVKMTRFYPVGLRPVDGGNADGAYCNIDFLEYTKQANRERLLIIQIEDPEPLEELDAIASLEGIDMIFFGPGDFSQAIGVPAQMNHPKILETYKRIAKVATDHGKFAGTVQGLYGKDDLAEMGYRFINIGGDVLGLSQYYKGLLEKFNK